MTAPMTTIATDDKPVFMPESAPELGVVEAAAPAPETGVEVDEDPGF